MILKVIFCIIFVSQIANHSKGDLFKEKKHFHLKDIEVNLTDDHFKPGKKLYNRIQERLRCFKKFTLILRWEPNDERICPSSIAKYFVEKGLQIEVCTPKLRVMRQYTNTIPVPNTDDIISLVEWMGMIAIGGDLNPENSLISSYSCEENPSVAGHVTAFNISGLFTSHHLQQLRQISREIIEKKVSSWVAVTAQCFSNTPSTRELKETKNYVPSDRILTVIYCGEDEMFCESFKSN